MVLEGGGGKGRERGVSEQGVRGKRVERVFVFCVNSPPTGRRWRARVNSKMDRKNTTIDQQIGQSETVLVTSFLLLLFDSI